MAVLLVTSALFPVVGANATTEYVTTVEFTTPGNHTWTVPVGVTNVSVTVVGGGSGGGGSSPWDPSLDGYGGPGGLAGQIIVTTIPVVPGNQYSITVGAGGTPGFGSIVDDVDYGGYGDYGAWIYATEGGAGGSSSFGSISAAGGQPQLFNDWSNSWNTEWMPSILGQPGEAGFGDVQIAERGGLPKEDILWGIGDPSDLSQFYGFGGLGYGAGGGGRMGTLNAMAWASSWLPDGWQSGDPAPGLYGGAGAPGYVRIEYVSGGDPPIEGLFANFTASPTIGDAPLAVQFTDTSTGNSASWSWDFDNDGVVDSVEQNPIHSYTTAGNYTVNLTVANIEGSDSEVKTDYITVTESFGGTEPPVANFTANVTSGEAPLNVPFTDTSTGMVTSWAWDFDNDGVVDSVEQNPNHTYTAQGAYTVNLTVANIEGSDSEVKTDYITVTEPEPVTAYSIHLSVSGTHAFPTQTVGYDPVEDLTILVNNTGNQPTGLLNVSLSNANFTVSPTSIDNITVGENATFTITPIVGLNEGTHTATVMVSGGNGISKSFDVCFTVTAAPIYGIDLSETGTYAFTNQTAGYGSITSHAVTVSNTGNQPTGLLNVTLSNANFTVSVPTISSIGMGENTSFTVTPVAGLSEGTYIATVMVLGGNGIGKSFDVRFTVTAAPTYGITVSESGIYAFTSQTVGYTSVANRTVTVNNIGVQPTGLLNVTLSNANFTVSAPTISSIGVGGNATFAVTPNHGLDEGTYTATVTVAGGNGINESFEVNFAVHPALNLLTITSPLDDTVSNEEITVAGLVNDPAIANVTLNHNGAVSIIPVQNGTFSTTVYLSDANTIVVTATDTSGLSHAETILLDGDLLPAAFELAIGFDPLDPDSGCSQYPDDLAGDGTIDGREFLDGYLPVFVKYRIGCDPFNPDTDGDGLTDAFELLYLGLLTDPTLIDTDDNGIPDPDEDLDGDGLTNLQEQLYGTDPLFTDNDNDGLSDSVEITAGTNPLLADSDDDGLLDDSELRLGTDPNNPDTNGDGILDGLEVYTSIAEDPALGVTVAVTGAGDLARSLMIYNFDSPLYTGTPARVGPVTDLQFADPQLNETVAPALVTLPYDPALANASTNISVMIFNPAIGTYEPVATTVDPVAHTVSATLSVPATVAVFDADIWEGLFFYPQADELVLWDGTLVHMDLDDIISTLDLVGQEWVVHLTTAELQDPGYQSFDDEASFPAGYYVIQCVGLYNNNVYIVPSLWRTGAIPAWENYGDGYGSTGGMVVSHSGYQTPVSHLPMVAYQTLLLKHEGGPITMWDRYSNPYYVYGDVTYTLMVYSDYDSDGDGIPDWLEKFGWWDCLGNVHTTDPNNPDTDGDGISDGEEAGEMIVTADGKIFFIIRSDPNSVDGDGDGISDYLERYVYGTDPLSRDTDGDGLTDDYEFEIGTDPFNPDSDGDGWVDGKEGEPLDAGTHEYGVFGAGRELVLGAVYGAYAEENHDNVYYMFGSVLSGILVFGDIRDAGVYISQGDKQMALVCLIGLVPGGGDGGKYIGKLARQFTEFPELALKKECREVAVEAIRKNCPTEIEKIAALDEIYAGSGTRLTGAGVQADDLIGIISESKKNGDLRLIQSGKRWGDRLVLYPDSQVNHYINKHVLGTEHGRPGTQVTFFPLGYEVRPGLVTPNAMTREQLDQLIDDSIRYGIQKLDRGDWVYIYQPNAYGIEEMKTITKTTGEFKSSYPTKGPNVRDYREPRM